MAKNEAVFTKDKEKKLLTVSRSFDAPLDEVWRAWSDSSILDLWWAPKPYRAETKSMDFRDGGRWLYAMVGPEGDKQWCRVDYTKVVAPESVSTTVMFCDEKGNENTEFPKMYWNQLFRQEGKQTTVFIEISFDSEADLETYLSMGFQEGFTAGLVNLDEYLAGK